jgi:hypothetical protein
MLMRYHWGLAVGHAYAHQRKNSVRDGDSQQDSDGGEDQEVYEEECAHDQRVYDGVCAQDQRAYDEEYGQYPSDSNSVSDCTDYLEGDYDIDYDMD